ncbi:VIT family protein [Glaciihabitans sp. UYNi722]|uniref:VIT1/CCC1 transporter family protein n=1 Tax=Glaciihabitans sp. UYNi722 TaxID=3156344 RepID=UPI003392271C
MTLTGVLHTHPDEPHAGNVSGRLNWLRAGVLGANDGIVSVAAIVVGVASAGAGTPAIITAGAAGLVGGAISMALGEYVSVSSQSDSQKALIEKERAELRDDPEGELEELVGLYQQQGLASATARSIAVELTAHDALRAHLITELNISEEDVVSAWHAAWVSAVAFTLGSVLPFAAIILLPLSVRIPVTFAAVIVALAVLGVVGARLGGGPVVRAVVRIVIGGAAALTATFAIGSLLGSSGIG